MTGEALDAHTRAWADRVNRSGAAYLTPAVLGGRWVVRVSIGAEADRAGGCGGGLGGDAEGGGARVSCLVMVHFKERHWVPWHP